ncbi:uncharacterized protein LOC128546035 [Mercenaria mercenaria]|uniref:uncharacterized protein LOC128546035 n=1 Tax=Mercenaria mercenaria TaxID=6596 RepID=UPI00234E996F|nr:uncharacterized protein LOC128546035 [Mercenaria mercenaria]
MTHDAVCRIRSTEANVMDGLRDYTEELRNQIKELTTEEINRTKLSCSVNSNKESVHMKTQTVPSCLTLTDNFVTVAESYTWFQHTAGTEREAELRTNTKSSEMQIKMGLIEKEKRKENRPHRWKGVNDDLKSSEEDHRRMSSYSNDKQQMQTNLIERYQQFSIKTDLSPLLPEVEIGVDQVYVPPQLYKTDRIDDYKVPEHEYYNIYGDVKKYRLKASEFLTNIVKKNILITADAGMGKTALCRQMVYAWCAAHENSFASPDPTSPSPVTEDSDVYSWFNYFRDIDFLFFISLKYCYYESTIEEMILKQLIDDRYSDSFYKLLQYEEEKCLVILDDLNEWMPPVGCRESPTISKGLPLREMKSKYATMYITRPWKLATIRPKSGEFDMIIELEGIDTDYTDTHIFLVSHYLNERTCRRRYSENFVASLTDKNLNHLKKYPLLSKLLLSLWHDKSNLDSSLAGIYSAVVDRLIGQAYRRDVLAHVDNCDEKNEHFGTLMTMFIGKEYVKRYFDTVVLPLAEFSFCLYKYKRRFCYIYETTNLCYYGLTEDKLKLFVDIGILSERICYGQSVSERCKTISFVYETFQEYFAAVYLSIYPDEISDCCSTAENILRMSLVFRILSGLNFSALKTISNRTLNIIDNDENCQDYRCGLSSYKGFVIEIQRMWSRCIKEARQCRIRIEPLSLRDIYLGYGTSEYMLSVCDLDFREIRSVYFDIKVPFYTQQHIVYASQLDTLVCNDAEYVDNIIMGDIVRKNQSSLKFLKLSGECLTDMDISANMFQKLRCLVIFETVLKGEQFAKIVTNSSSLEKVRLYNVCISGFEDVWNEATSSDTFPLVSSLQHLMVSNCDNMFRSVSLLPSLKYLHFERSSSEILNDILCKSTCLTELTIQEVDIGSDRCLAIWVSKQQHLKLLCLHAVEVSQFLLCDLLAVVGHLPMAVRVKLDDVEQEEGENAKDVLHHLDSTKLYSNSIMAFDAIGNCIKNADMLSFGTKELDEYQ